MVIQLSLFWKGKGWWSLSYSFLFLEREGGWWSWSYSFLVLESGGVVVMAIQSLLCKSSPMVVMVIHFQGWGSSPSLEWGLAWAKAQAQAWAQAKKNKSCKSWKGYKSLDGRFFKILKLSPKKNLKLLELSGLRLKPKPSQTGRQRLLTTGIARQTCNEQVLAPGLPSDVNRHCFPEARFQKYFGEGSKQWRSRSEPELGPATSYRVQVLSLRGSKLM